jgi:hypothetical protein
MRRSPISSLGRILTVAAGLGALVPAGVALGQTGIRVVSGDRRSTEISSATDADQYLFSALAGTKLTVVVRATSGDLDP